MKKNIISMFRFLCKLSYLILFIAGLVSKNYVLIFITASAILLGPIFCGWMCVFGFYQDCLRHVGRLIKKEPIELDQKFHRVLKYSRYVFLFAGLFIGGLFFFPASAKHNFSLLIKGHPVIDATIYFLIALSFLSLFSERFFCRYFCAYGAKLGLFSLFRLITINRDDSCISCKLCSRKCPMHIDVDKIKSLASPNCINCLKCVECCPKNSLKIGLRNYFKL